LLIGSRKTVGGAGFSGEEWFDWEERPGPEPASDTGGPDDGLLVHVCYVEGKAKV